MWTNDDSCLTRCGHDGAYLTSQVGDRDGDDHSDDHDGRDHGCDHGDRERDDRERDDRELDDHDGGYHGGAHERSHLLIYLHERCVMTYTSWCKLFV